MLRNRSGEVGLADLTIFTGDYFGGYAFRSDFEYDMSINLADLIEFYVERHRQPELSLAERESAAAVAERAVE